MSEEYPIHEVKEAWRLEEEQMGTKKKFWYRYPEKNERWLFKYPRENTGEHWAEKIAAEIAKALDISHAEVELAEVDGVQGSTTLSFIEPQTMELLHGNDFLSQYDPGYDRTKRFGQNNHAIDHIWGVFEIAQSIFQNERMP